MELPRQHTCSDNVKEWRRFNNDDIWMSNYFACKDRSKASKGQLSQRATHKALVRTGIAPYTYHAHIIKHFLREAQASIFGGNDACGIIRESRQHRHLVPHFHEVPRCLAH